MTDKSFLSVRNVSNAYVSRPWGIIGKKENKPVLNNISFEIERGEIFGLVGESGCGKTTLAKCILGLTDYEGEIIINGRKREARPSFAERQRNAFDVQAVFQNPSSSLNPVKTVGWILEEPLKAHRLGSEMEREKRVENSGSCGAGFFLQKATAGGAFVGAKTADRHRLRFNAETGPYRG